MEKKKACPNTGIQWTQDEDGQLIIGILIVTVIIVINNCAVVTFINLYIHVHAVCTNTANLLMSQFANAKVFSTSCYVQLYVFIPGFFISDVGHLCVYLNTVSSFVSNVSGSIREV